MKYILLSIFIICSPTLAYQNLIVLGSSKRGGQNPLNIIKKHAQDKAVIMFCKPSCRYCKLLSPKFRTLANKNKNKAQFILVNVTDNAYESQFDFSTYPTVIYKRKGKTIKKHGSNNGSMTVYQMQKHVNSL